MRVLDGGDLVNDGLIGFWPLDEGAGQRYRDISPNRRTAFGGFGSGGSVPPVWRQGLGGKEAVFGASNCYVNLGKPSYFDNLQLPLTISAWIYPTDVSGNRTIFGQYSNFTINGGIGKLFRLESGSLYYYTTSNSAPYQSTTSGPSISANQRTFVAVVVEGTVSSPTWRLHKNGIAPTTGSFGAALYSSGPVSDECYIGNQTRSVGIVGGAELFIGRISTVRLHNRALSVEEVRRLYSEPWAGTVRERRRVWYLPAGGTTYDDSTSDSVTAAESLAVALTGAGSFSDAATAAQALAAALVGALAQSDSATAAESVAAAVAAVAAVADGASVAEALAAALTAAIALSDAGTAADSVTNGQVYNDTLAETLTAADSLAAGLSALLALSDDATAAESLAALLTGTGATTDAATVAEALAAIRAAVATTSDSLTAADVMALAAAVLFPPPAWRTGRIAAEVRSATVAREVRAGAVAAQSRSVTVPPEAPQ